MPAERKENPGASVASEADQAAGNIVQGLEQFKQESTFESELSAELLVTISI